MVRLGNDSSVVHQPRFDLQMIGHEGGVLALEQGAVPADHVLFVDIQVVLLTHDWTRMEWRRHKRCCYIMAELQKTILPVCFFYFSLLSPGLDGGHKLLTVELLYPIQCWMCRWSRSAG